MLSGPDPFCIFGRRHHEEQLCEIILILDQWFRGKCRLKVFLIWSSGSPFVQRNHLCNFGRGYYEEQFCEIILNLGQWFKRYRLKDFFNWSSGRGPIYAILKEVIMGNIHVKLYEIWTRGSGGNVLRKSLRMDARRTDIDRSQ